MEILCKNKGSWNDPLLLKKSDDRLNLVEVPKLLITLYSCTGCLRMTQDGTFWGMFLQLSPFRL